MPLGAAPDADDQVHRDQAGLEEDVEEEDVLRHEDAEHQRLHEQEGGHIFRHPPLDRFPAGGMQIGIRKTVSTISMRAMPSMPSAQAKRPNSRAAYSWNCHCGRRLVSRPRGRCRERRSPAWRAERSSARCWPRRAGRRSPPSSGNASMTERIGEIRPSYRAIAQVRGGGDAEQHHQSIGVEIAGLEPGGEHVAGDRPRRRRRRGRSGRSCPRRPASRRSGRATGPGGRRGRRRSRRNTIC